MTRHALGGQRRIGMVAVPEQYREGVSEDPPVYPIGCEGRIEQAIELPDGRFNIVLEGVGRFRILEEPDRPASQLFRAVRREPLGENATEAALASVGERRGDVVQLLMDLLERIDPERAERVDRQQFDQIDAETFVNAVAQSVEFTLADKQSLLEANGVSERCDQLIALLRFRLAELDAGASRERGLLH